MTNDTKALVDEVRNQSLLLHECAGTIESQSATIERLERELDDVKTIQFPARIEKVTGALKERIECIQRERDIADALLEKLLDAMSCYSFGSILQRICDESRAYLARKS